MTGVQAVRLVARREFTERLREKSFRISTIVSIVIVAVIAVLPGLLGLGGDQKFTVGVADRADRPVAAAAVASAGRFDAEVKVEAVAPRDVATALEDESVDVVLQGGTIRSNDTPDTTLVNILQSANAGVRSSEALRQAGVSGQEARAALDPPPLQVATAAGAEDDDEKAGIAFIVVLILYGQLLAYGYWVASGVVEEKASRVVEVLLSTIRSGQLLAGKIIGLGLLGLTQLLLIAVIGVAAAGAAGAVDIDLSLFSTVALAVAWFVLGYAFYACAYAVAGAIVPRQEELQSSTTPLTMLILVSFFLAFAALNDPDGTLARVASFVPFSAPMIMPVRIALGEVGAVEVIASIAVTAGAAAALVPLAARIYSGAVLRTGSSIKLKDAWRAARA